MLVTDNRKELIRCLAVRNTPLIAIDGWHGAGKSWLARSVGFVTGRTWIDLDTLLERDRRAFVDHLDLATLATMLGEEGRFVLSGVCMREALSRIRHPIACHVYLKQMERRGWTEEDEANGRGSPVDQHAPPGALELEVRAYHTKWMPHLLADYVLERKAYAE